MRNFSIIGVLVLGVLFVMAPSAFAYPNPPKQDASGGADATIANVALTVVFTPAGTTNFVVHNFSITDAGVMSSPTEIEWICAIKEGGSTLPDRYIQQIKLYWDTNTDGMLDLPPAVPSDSLLGIIRNPNLTNGVCFGQAGRLLVSIPNNGSRNFLLVADFGMEAPDLLDLRLVVEAVPSNALVGGADISNSFIPSSDYALGDFVTIRNTTLIGGAQLVVEQNDVEAAPGASNAMLGQFDLEDLGGDDRDLCVQHFTAILTGYRGGVAQRDVLQGLQSLAVYVESGSTPPGFQTTDRLVGMIARPFLVGEKITRGGEEGLLVVLGRRNRILMRLPDGQIERLYVVGNLGAEFQDGDEIKLEVIAGARDYSGANCSSGFDIDPSTPVAAYNSVFIRIPPAQLVIGNAVVSSTGKLRISLKNVPAPGLDSLEAIFTYNADVADVVNVRALGNYQVEWNPIVTGNTGELLITVDRKSTRPASLGSFDLLEIEFDIGSTTAAPGDKTQVDVAVTHLDFPLEATLRNGDLLDLDIVPGMVEVLLLRGDVDRDGVVTRRDSRMLARWLVGRLTPTLTALQKQLADADRSCPETTNWTALEPGGCVNATDVRWIREAAAGLRTLSTALTPLSAGELGGVKLLVVRDSLGSVHFSALGAKSLRAQIFDLTGRTVFAEQTTTGALRFDGLSQNGGLLANGVYLYVVTVVTEDGRSFKTEVRKLLLQR